MTTDGQFEPAQARSRPSGRQNADSSAPALGPGGIPLALVLLDSRGQITFLTQAARDLFQPLGVSLQGTSYQTLFDQAIRFAEDPRSARELLESARLSVVDQPVLELAFRDPLPAVQEWRFFSRRSSAGAPVGWGVLIADRSERAAAERDKNQLMIELSRQMRSSLAAAAGGLEAVNANYLSWDRELMGDFLTETGAQVRQVESSLDQLLQFLTWQESGVAVYPRQVELDAVLSGLSQALSRELPGTHVTLDLPDHVPAVRVDPSALHRGLLYLIRAAAGPSGLTLTVRPRDRWVDLILRGDLRGLESEFTTGEAKRSGAVGKPNAALKISRRIIAALGGSFRVKAPDDRDSMSGQIRIRVPRMLEQDRVQASAPAGEPAPGGEQRILVVEHQPEDQELLTGLLEKAGYRVDLAVNGLTALDLVQARSPDLVVLNREIPELSGINLIRSIRRWSRVPMLVLSSTPDHRGLVRALEAGADDYLTKPFILDELLARIHAVLRRSAEQPQDGGEIYQGKDLRIDYAARLVWVRGEQVQLTPIEYALLSTLTRHPHRVMSYQQLIERAWEGPDQGSRQGLFVHISRLREKIERDPEHPQLIKTRWGVGYVFGSE